MTGRDRLLAVFRGEQADMVPFAPNLYLWFHARKALGKLPAELAGAQHPFEALRHLGAEILARWDTMAATHSVYGGGPSTLEYAGNSGIPDVFTTAYNTYPPGRGTCSRRFHTPYGALRQTWNLSLEAGTDYQSEFLWKSWDDFKAIRYLLETTSYVFDSGEFQSWVDRVGDDGLMMVHITQSPLKTFHWLAGAGNASLFIADHPEEMKELALIHEAKALSLLESIVDDASAEVFMSLENLDSMFYSPRLYRDFCDSFFSRAAEMIHARDKILMVHACGRVRVLLPLVGRSGVDCLEGITPAPAGNVELSEARRLTGSNSFTVNGGMDAHHLEIAEDSERRIHDYTRRLFESMGEGGRFIFASSCGTSVPTPWENLTYFRDAARAYG